MSLSELAEEALTTLRDEFKPFLRHLWASCGSGGNFESGCMSCRVEKAFDQLSKHVVAPAPHDAIRAYLAVSDELDAFCASVANGKDCHGSTERSDIMMALNEDKIVARRHMLNATVSNAVNHALVRAYMEAVDLRTRTQLDALTAMAMHDPVSTAHVQKLIEKTHAAGQVETSARTKLIEAMR